MKQLVWICVFGICSAGAGAQGIAPLTGKEQITAELARNVSPGWSNKHTWRDGVPAEISWSREADGLEVITGPTESILIDPKTLFHYPASNAGIKEGGVWKLRTTLATSSGKKDQPLEPGLTWKAERSSDSAPVSWCPSNKTQLESSFEVGAKEAYTLMIDDKPVTLDVVPVVEKGYWTRCYGGKRFTRYLVSKELGAIVSIEYIGYTPTGDVHDSSYRLSFKAINHR